MWLYLDDVRTTPTGYERATTAQQAIDLLATGRVQFASLDHDLGACEACHKDPLKKAAWQDVTPNCEHFGTGMTVIEWLETNQHYWPRDGVHVHSMNPSGRARMEQVVRKWYGRTFQKR